MSEVDDRRAEQVKEWGSYVATSAIDYDGVRAYNVGDPVPASNVSKYGYERDGLVRAVNNDQAGE